MTRQRGFTMIEVLVACAVIVILMGLLFLGGRAIVNSNKAKSTRATLANLQGMVTAREAARGATGVKDEIVALFAATPALTAVNGAPPPTHMPMDGSAIPNDFSEHSAARTAPPTDGHLARTQRVMGLLMAIPANKTSVQNLPPEQLLETVRSFSPGGTAPLTLDNATPILLDGWGTPILVVPPAGVTLQYETGARTVRSPDGKAFFMSAGPDGIFSVNASGKACADDNLLSFEN